MNTTIHPRQNRKTIVLCIVFFVVFLTFSFFKKNLQPIDITVNLWMITIHNDTAILLAKVLSAVFDTIPLLIASLVVAGFLFIKNYKPQSLLFLVGVGGNALFVAIIKNIAQVTRPENQLLYSSGFSYPSGHITGVIIFIGLIVYFAWLNWHNSQCVKILSSTIFGLIVVFVSFDRIYLNVHWLSDVIGGCLFGAFWLSFYILICEQLKVANKFTFKRA